MSEPIDAVIILGKGVNPDGSLPDIVQHELDYVLRLLAQQPTPLVIVSGRQWGLAGTSGTISEAQAMADYFHINSNMAVQLEDQSLDTIGNLVFSKQILDQHHAKHILVVSTVAHLVRVKYIVSQLFDRSYHFSYHGHQHLFSPLEYVHTVRYELCSSLYAHWFFWKFCHQSNQDLATYLRRHHFMYRASRLRQWLTWVVQRPVHR